MLDWLWVPRTHDVVARHWNSAMSGVSARASRTPSRASTFTPLSTGVLATDMVSSCSRVGWCGRGRLRIAGSAPTAGRPMSPRQGGPFIA